MKDWVDRTPALADLAPEHRRLLAEGARVMEAPRGAVLFGPGQAPSGWLLLLEGRIRVAHLSESGREIVLYRVHAGESCVMTTACLFADEEYAATAVAESDLVAVATPRALFDALAAASAPFRRLVFSAYARRVTDLCLVVDEIAFQRVDLRLARKLLELADAGGVRATHQQLAVELGTAREVVSRQLHEFQRRGWIAASRGDVRFLDEPALRAFAQAGGGVPVSFE